jgi:hypothetical protein
LCKLPRESGRLDEVDESSAAADLDHRQPLAVALLERRVARDVDLGELERRLCARGLEQLARAVAEAAPLRGVQDDLRYG